MIRTALLRHCSQHPKVADRQQSARVVFMSAQAALRVVFSFENRFAAMTSHEHDHSSTK